MSLFDSKLRLLGARSGYESGVTNMRAGQLEPRAKAALTPEGVKELRSRECFPAVCEHLRALFGRIHCCRLT